MRKRHSLRSLIAAVACLPAVGCISVTPMDFVPDAVRTLIESDRKQAHGPGPISVDQMLVKARPMTENTLSLSFETEGAELDARQKDELAQALGALESGTAYTGAVSFGPFGAKTDTMAPFRAIMTARAIADRLKGKVDTRKVLYDPSLKLGEIRINVSATDA